MIDLFGTVLGSVADLLTPAALRPRRESGPVAVWVLRLVLGLSLAIATIALLAIAR